MIYLKENLIRVRLIQNSQVFNSWTETNDCLNAQAFKNHYIAELPYCIEDFEKCRQKGLGQFILKVFDVKNNTITETPNTNIQKKEDLTDEEVVRMKTMMNQL